MKRLALVLLAAVLAGCAMKPPPRTRPAPCLWPCGHPESAGLDRDVCHPYPDCLVHPERAWWVP